MILEKTKHYIVCTDLREAIDCGETCWRSGKKIIGLYISHTYGLDVFEKTIEELQKKYPQTYPKSINERWYPLDSLYPKYLKYKKLEAPPDGFPEKPRRGWVCYGVISGKIYSNQLHFDAREASWAAHRDLWIRKEIEIEKNIKEEV